MSSGTRNLRNLMVIDNPFDGNDNLLMVGPHTSSPART